MSRFFIVIDTTTDEIIGSAALNGKLDNLPKDWLYRIEGSGHKTMELLYFIIDWKNSQNSIGKSKFYSSGGQYIIKITII